MPGQLLDSLSITLQQRENDHKDIFLFQSTSINPENINYSKTRLITSDGKLLQQDAR